MKIRCVWEHRGEDSILYLEDFAGAFCRGESLSAAEKKLHTELEAYCAWAGFPACSGEVFIAQEKESELNIADADSDVLFEAEKKPLSMEEYRELKALAMKSAEDFMRLYLSVPDKNRSCLPERKSFYGPIPRTAEEMYLHTKNVNSYYFGEINAQAHNEGDIVQCRRRGFEALEKIPGFLEQPCIEGSYGEFWSLRKLLRRFIWHDRIHAKAMYRMAVKTFGKDSVPNIFGFIGI